MGWKLATNLSTPGSSLSLQKHATESWLGDKMSKFAAEISSAELQRLESANV